MIKILTKLIQCFSQKQISRMFSLDSASHYVCRIRLHNRQILLVSLKILSLFSAIKFSDVKSVKLQNVLKGLFSINFLSEINI